MVFQVSQPFLYDLGLVAVLYGQLEDLDEPLELVFIDRVDEFQLPDRHQGTNSILFCWIFTIRNQW